ncbi:MAG: DNA mismatch repair protein MutS [Spirochaetes bacterium]|nr:DNA mismatch repair protein MutS [Spirochaetota bacterium]MBU0953815.1 DNA mismatch repair protein MutS [Spirochaetota bacterium]
MAEQISLIDQYERIKAEYPDTIVFFRLGDFYEMFNQDAIEASRILNLTLTKRQASPMCGVPWHASRAYIARLLKAGRKVAICEQLSPPKKGKGIIERKVVEVISPGTVSDEDFLDSNVDNYVLALAVINRGNSEHLALAWLSTSTGEFRAASFPAADREILRRELCRIAPKELVVRESSLNHPVAGEILAEYSDAVINRLPDWSFSQEQGVRRLTAHFGTIGLQGFGFSDDDPALAAAGALIEYVQDFCKASLAHISNLQNSEDQRHMAIDESTQRNLEIVRNLRDGSRNYSLLSTIDYTLTPMGARKLRRRLLQPLRDINVINQRLDMVQLFYHDQHLLESLRSQLKQCMDLERLSARLSMEKANPKELLSVRQTVAAALEISGLYQARNTPVPSAFLTAAQIEICRQIDTLLTDSILEEPALSPVDGPVIRAGWNSDLDTLRSLKDSAQSVLSAYLEEEKSSSGLSGLRLKYNRIIGYHLELGKQSAKNVPEHFIRRQSVANAERFSTERLGALETEISSAADRIIELESSIFASVRTEVRQHTGFLLQLASLLADLDCNLSSATCATLRAYTRPEVVSQPLLDIKGGRHPVVEAHLPDNNFIPNDTELDSDGRSFALLTGPNMAGKSTYLRQNALIVLLAQAGCFVPAATAKIGICDRIFCRVGAQDNLARGESTFLLEMHETASILNNASRNSLVIMDEVGRGTGTQDGLAIAWAVSEYMLNVLQCRTLFATHYHELTAMEHQRLIDISMAVEERAGAVVFLKRVVAGPAAGSYGIHVAGLAGVPKVVVDRAADLRSLLAVREAHHDIRTASQTTRPQPAASTSAVKSGVKQPKVPASSPELFSGDEMVLSALAGLDINNLTPLQAMQQLASFQAMLKQAKN